MTLYKCPGCGRPVGDDPGHTSFDVQYHRIQETESSDPPDDFEPDDRVCGLDVHVATCKVCDKDMHDWPPPSGPDEMWVDGSAIDLSRPCIVCDEYIRFDELDDIDVIPLKNNAFQHAECAS